MDSLTILNYQGSKKNLLGFIHDTLETYLNNDDVIFDIFSGTGSVAYSYKRNYSVYANDAEIYAATVARAILGEPIYPDECSVIKNQYKDIFNKKQKIYGTLRETETHLLNIECIKDLIELYESIPTVWTTDKKYMENDKYSLFFKYYSGSYFGINQACDIDIIREIIDLNPKYQDVLLASLFFAMKESVFSKDGHMAQPLDITKNQAKLIKVRKRNILDLFIEKLDDFTIGNLVYNPDNTTKVFNCNFEDILEKREIIDEVTVIYADPPYTDMQYSRYYHLLNTLVEYNYPEVTRNKNGFTKGLYLENRFQSQLSKKSTCLNSMKKLIEFSKKYNKCLVISFAYPKDIERQKTDRYVMDIDDLINACILIYGEAKVKVHKINYKHSNNRNSESKKVFEYLIICEREV